MRCPACNADNLTDSLYCEECGVPLESACSPCGAANRPSVEFCRKCRASLGSRAAAAETLSRPHSTPKHLLEKILQSKSALEGERKHVTVLFADVKGSMELSEQLDPEAWSAIMQRFFKILAEGVERFVDKFTGDAVGCELALRGAARMHRANGDEWLATKAEARIASAAGA